MKKKYRFFSAIIIVLIAIVLSITLDQQNIQDTSTNTNVNDNQIEKENIRGDLQIYFFDVGQADSILVKNDNQTMLIDAGNEKNGDDLVKYIKGVLQISKINYLVATHAHADHIGGMDKIIDNFDIEKIYMPYTTNVTTKQFEQLITSIENKHLSITEINVNDKFIVGNAECTVMCVDHTEPDELNLSSIVIEMIYVNEKYLFMGDAEIENENSRTWRKVDVLKVGHHGSNTSTSDRFLNQVKPDIAIISVGKDNIYGLPKDSVIQNLAGIGTQIYRTDIDGTILITSDGNTNKVEKININK